MIVNDQIVGRLGQILSAPVGEVALVEVPDALASAEPQMSHMPGGISHGSLLLLDCSERSGLDHLSLAENRARFAMLAILYGWIGANDQQFIYENRPPHLVHSVDHGHFLPGGPNWTSASLSAAASPVPDPTIVAGAGLIDDEVRIALQNLKEVNPTAIASAVAAVPDDWGMSLDESVDVAIYLEQRQSQLVAPLSSRT
jgi:hypothetical protein